MKDKLEELIDDIKSTIRNRKANCEEYSDLDHILCELLDIAKN